jgi:hypothetical protein
LVHCGKKRAYYVWEIAPAGGGVSTASLGRSLALATYQPVISSSAESMNVAVRDIPINSTQE